VPVTSRGFHGRRDRGANVPPGQYVVGDFPVLSAGPTPRTDLDRWSFTIATETGAAHSWSWERFRALPSQRFTTDIHCVTKWSKLGTQWEGVSLDTLLDGIETDAAYALATCDGGYTTNVPMADLRDGQAWIAYGYGGAALTPEHGGPARLLVPHLYLWKSAKWVRGERAGRVDAAMLAAYGWAPAHMPRCYLCGPTGFVEAMADLLVAAGHEPGRVRTERFG
jgi:DMSO/TMAO reductase YedYZ molybdopterin-dependent catalytic subunit